MENINDGLNIPVRKGPCSGVLDHHSNPHLTSLHPGTAFISQSGHNIKTTFINVNNVDHVAASTVDPGIHKDAT